MRLLIVSGNLRLSEAMREYLNWRARFALGRLAAVLRAVRISVRDENGARGGGHKRCRVLLYPRRGGTIVVETSGEQLKPLIDRTLARASRTLARAVKHAAVRRLEL